MNDYPVAQSARIIDAHVWINDAFAAYLYTVGYGGMRIYLSVVAYLGTIANISKRSDIASFTNFCGGGDERQRIDTCLAGLH